MPICLFGADASRFEYAYIAGFGSTNFADICWTSKERVQIGKVTFGFLGKSLLKTVLFYS